MAASRATAQPAETSAAVATTEDEQPSPGRLKMPLPCCMRDRSAPCSTVVAASVPFGPALPTATVNSPVWSWLRLALSNVETVVELDVVTRTWVPPNVTTVKLLVLASATVPAAKPKDPGRGRRETGLEEFGGLRRFGTPTLTLRAAIVPLELVPCTMTDAPSVMSLRDSVT